MSYTKEIKKQALKMRDAGKSYAYIKQELDIPKSTLSTWFSKSHAHIFDRTKQIAHLKKIRPIALASIQKRIVMRDKELADAVAKEFKKYPTKDIGFQKAILASLYWAEGAKHKAMSGIKFANTDPTMVKLFITLLRNCFSIDESRLRVDLHIHYYHGKKECRQFWSKVLDIPKEYFHAPYLKKRSKTKRFRKNFMGICFLYYYDSNIRREFMEISRQLHSHYCQ